MHRKAFDRFVLMGALAGLINGSLEMACNHAVAQIVPDNSLSTNSQVTSVGNLMTIDGGAIAGTNLFHSFRDFSVLTGSRAWFNNGLAIQNILARVTGTTISHIDGLIRTNGTANLFLLNPNGIIFGTNARLDIGGSFVASTASSIKFGDGKEFSAQPTIDRLLSGLLSVSVPLGLQLGQRLAGIRVEQAAKLEVQPGQSLILVGGDINLDGGILSAPAGNIDLAGLTPNAAVVFNWVGNSLGLDRSPSVDRLDVKFTNGAIADVRGDVRAQNGGSVNIYARNLTMSDHSQIIAGIPDRLGSNQSVAADIHIRATGELNMQQSSQISNSVGVNATGKGGNIYAIANSISLADGSQIATDTSGVGNAGNIILEAIEAIALDGASNEAVRVSSRANSQALGNSGQITLTTKDIMLTHGARLATDTSGRGNAGDVLVQASNQVLLDGISYEVNGTDGTNGSFSGVSSTVQPDAVGASGNITVIGQTIALTNGAQLNNGIYGSGQGQPSSVIVKAIAGITIDGFEPQLGLGSSIFSGLGGDRAEGIGGDISLEASDISVTNGAYLATVTLGSGNSGGILIKAKNSFLLSGFSADGPSGLFSGVTRAAVGGDGGDIRVIARSVAINHGAVISTDTSSIGNSGSVIVQADDGISISGGGDYGPSRIISSVIAGAEGKGGEITLTARSLAIDSGAVLAANTQSIGNAGNINVQVTENISFDGSGIYRFGDGFEFSGIFSEVRQDGNGKGGDVNISARDITLTRGAQISSNAIGQGEAGMLRITAKSVFLDSKALITATTTSGEGGDISLQAQSLTLRQNSAIATTAGGNGNGGNLSFDVDAIAALENSDITANALQGRGGNVQINTQGLFGTAFRAAQTPNSDITASSEFGLDGVVVITTPEVDPSQSLVSLPSEIIDTTKLIARSCENTQDSSFVITGRGGLPSNSSQMLNASRGWIDWRNAANVSDRNLKESGSQVDIPASQAPLKDGIVTEAQGWQTNSKGEIILTAQVSQPGSQNSMPGSHPIWLKPADCHVK